ncbi:innexin inx2-like isoform X2 [Clytia hemisphaerica]|uniref:Innexin n=1 Tax=Clytia hemisphaerica TaxID=252671 RepID=A0A7M5TQ52_9CNID
MVSFISSDIKDIFTIKLKTRQDDYTDQFSRIFMVKMFMVSALVMGFDWFQDTVNCMIPDIDLHKVGEDFVHSACWIQGFYVYPQLSELIGETNYYGIPKDISKNGVNAKGQLCEMKQGQYDCMELRRLYFLQYQWMPFFVASAAIIYYLPYIIYQIFNTDVQSLKETIQKEKVNGGDIVENFFNYDINTIFQMRFNVLMNLVVKILYLAVNLGVFYLTDHLLNGGFQLYGKNWLDWAALPNQESYDFKTGTSVKPGDVLLPTFGFCEIYESSSTKTFKYNNKSKFICEISLNVMYQYIFIILWFFMLAGIFISAFGILHNIAGHTITVIYFIRESPSAKALFRSLSFRECEYLSVIRHQDSQLYHDVMERIRLKRPELAKFSVNGKINAPPLSALNCDTYKETAFKEGSIYHGNLNML